MVSNKTFSTFGVHGEHFKWSCDIMTNNATHDLILKKVHRLAIIHLQKTQVSDVQ